MLVRDFSSVVLVLPGSMGDGWENLSVRSRIASQLVGNKLQRWPALVFQDLAKEALGSSLVSVGCDQDIEDIAILVHRSPKIMTFAPRMVMNTSSTCQMSPRRPCRRRRVRAYSGPNLRHQNRMASYDTVTPRSARRSSTSRKLSVNRWYSQTAWLMISGGKRWRRYSDPIGRMSPIAVNLAMPSLGARRDTR